MTKLLDPKMDFIFKNIFGSEKHKGILISFLNAVIKPIDPIAEVELKETEILKEAIEDKYSRLDVKAKTDRGEFINIEIQLKNEYNMIKRSLYYWSKMYEGQLEEGETYNKLSKTICINLLDFKYLKTELFHTRYRLLETATFEELTDVMELHFIEIPKLPKDSDVSDMLVAWMEFLKDPESEKTRALEMTSKEIKEAKDELIKISNDDTQRALYELREKSNKDRNSALENSRMNGIQEGMEIGEKKGKLETARKMLSKGMSREDIMELTGLTLEEIESFK